MQVPLCPFPAPPSTLSNGCHWLQVFFLFLFTFFSPFSFLNLSSSSFAFFYPSFSFFFSLLFFSAPSLFVLGEAGAKGGAKPAENIDGKGIKSLLLLSLERRFPNFTRQINSQQFFAGHTRNMKKKTWLRVEWCLWTFLPLSIRRACVQLSSHADIEWFLAYETEFVSISIEICDMVTSSMGQEHLREFSKSCRGAWTAAHAESFKVTTKSCTWSLLDRHAQ